MKKKLFALVLCLILAVSMAVPAFADWTLRPDTIGYSSYNCLNIYGNVGDNMNGRALTLWYTQNPGTDQLFNVQYTTYGGVSVMYLRKIQYGTYYAINRADYNNAYGKQAIMWKLTDGYRDSAFLRPSPRSTHIANLAFYNESMKYQGDFSGASVYFAGQRYQGNWFVSGSPTL